MDDEIVDVQVKLIKDDEDLKVIQPIEYAKNETKDTHEDVPETESLLSYYEKHDALEAPEGIKDIDDDKEETKSTGMIAQEIYYDKQY
jgi:hypothetical protein